MSDERAVSGAVETPASTISPRAWWAAVLYIASLALFLRFYDLPLKPLHHDEGVNVYLLTKLVRPPHSYQYHPSNYHGPTLYTSAGRACQQSASIPRRFVWLRRARDWPSCSCPSFSGASSATWGR